MYEPKIRQGSMYLKARIFDTSLVASIYIGTNCRFSFLDKGKNPGEPTSEENRTNTSTMYQLPRMQIKTYVLTTHTRLPRSNMSYAYEYLGFDTSRLRSTDKNCNILAHTIRNAAMESKDVTVFEAFHQNFPVQFSVDCELYQLGCLLGK
ncbi:hypothetical protein CSKR_201081 [Clonorchis sinensis]|uniref:Uncharacterized protein n=1 Tax=Clonorchis sinensis TaxID=79923 RepID=A0A8T1MKN4_CLOSI|nr:hypothetical protein CSKR_201081 [Clonorchis sinensis]